MAKGYELVIFDWDGTLVDSADLIVECMQSAFSDLSLSIPTNDDVRNIIGLGLGEAIVELNGPTNDDVVRQLREAYSLHFHKNDVDELNVFSGVYEMLEALRGSGCMTAVATGKSRKGLTRGLSRFKCADHFVSTRCADETRSKPHPLMLEQIINEVGVDLQKAIMVGDSVYDMEMAQRIGMDSVGVTYGVHCSKRLGEYGPVCMADNVSALADFLLNNAK